ncbi:DUF3973 domain-containing protein [Priestia megaterium]|uniref:DUF3973 domain-containing protein n=1 Tax=Priestia megaterium TaxID=1404 RepID=UPI00345A9B01
MYYCVRCSKLHDEQEKENIFQNGFYIDPYLLQKVHLGMCVHKSPSIKQMRAVERLETKKM